MTELIAETPFKSIAPRQIGDLVLEEADLGILTSIAPFNGQTGAASKLLKASHGVDFPAPNRSARDGDAMIVWFGKDIALLAGPLPAEGLRNHAALTDQSDAWAALRLSGRGAEDVLARLVPVDVRLAQFPKGHTARTLIGHMHGSITRLDADTYLLMVYRSMAETLSHELETAMENVAARS